MKTINFIKKTAALLSLAATVAFTGAANAQIAGHNVLLVHGFQFGDLSSKPSDSEVYSRDLISDFWMQRAEGKLNWSSAERVEGRISEQIFEQAKVYSQQGTCSNGCVLVIHSTGDQVMRHFLANQEVWMTNAGYEPLNIVATIDFGGAGGGAKGALSKLFTPLKAIGNVIGKLFLPITIIMGIFDGYQGFMDEFEKEGSILDGIRGAVTGIVDGFIGGLVRLVTDAIGWMLEKLGLEHMATIITDFGNDVTASFSTAVGGLVDFVTGIFSLDLERITKGLKNLVGSTADFLFTLVTTPVDAAIAFVSDIFNLGDPDNPFTIRGFLFGDEATGQEGVVTKAVNFFKDLFHFLILLFKNLLFFQIFFHFYY